MFFLFNIHGLYETLKVETVTYVGINLLVLYRYNLFIVETCTVFVDSIYIIAPVSRIKHSTMLLPG